MGLISYPLQDERRESVRQLIIAFGEVWPDSHHGPMHILISDYNALDHNLVFCRGFVQAMLNRDEVFQPDEGRPIVLKEYEPHDEKELRASLLLLDILTLIPEEWRDVHAETVDDEDA
jgi:hypothetical protein